MAIQTPIKARTITGAAFGLLLLAGCGASGITNQPATSSSSVATSSSAAATPTAVTVAHLGSTIKLGGNTPGEGLSVQLIKIVDPAAPTNVYGAATTGSHYVAVQFRITDSGTLPYSDFTEQRGSRSGR